MPWYTDWFDREEYELVYRERDEEEAERAAGFIEGMAEPAPGAHLLDVGCGRGRHARAFARRGYRVTGLDLSERAIRTARRRATEESLAIDFRQQDMRAPMGTAAFDGAVNLFSSFGYFGSSENDSSNGDDEHQQVIARVAEALRPPGEARRGGFFVQDFMNAPAVRASLVPRSTREAGGLQIEERRWIAGGRIEKEITLRPAPAGAGSRHASGDGAPARPRSGHAATRGHAAGGHGSHAAEARGPFRESVRLLELSDFRHFYERAGLRLEETFGNYDGAPYRKDSPRLIMLARKTA